MVDSINVAQLVIPQGHAVSTPNLSSVTLPNPAPAQPATTDQVDISPQAAQQPVQPKVQYANPEVLGTEAVTMYMVNGQLYTRYRNEITNKVTYVPNEAQVLQGNNSSNNSAQPVLNMTV